MKIKLEQPATSDADLFQRAVDGAIPIASSNRVPPPRPAPRIQHQSKSVPAPTITDNWSDHGSGEVAPTSFLRAGLSNMTLRKLRRGLWPVRDEVDLHGLTSDEARRILAGFLNHALGNHYRCVNVIHGKGWRAEGGEGILKIRVRHWLTQHPQVLAFCEAPVHAGGGGAVWVLLKHHI